MDKPIFCNFNIDTGCVELRYADKDVLRINVTGVENSIETNIYSRAELDWLVYNDPLSYAQMVLDGTLKDYLRKVSWQHSIETDT